jgi:hypothetical protein
VGLLYNLQCRYSVLTVNLDVTVEVHTLSLKEHTKPKGVLEVVSSSAEFDTIPIRHHKDALLCRIYGLVPEAQSCRLRSTPLQDVPPRSSPLLADTAATRFRR